MGICEKQFKLAEIQLNADIQTSSQFTLNPAHVDFTHVKIVESQLHCTDHGKYIFND